MYTMKKNGEEQIQASRNTETLMIDLKQGKRKFTDVDRAAEERRVSLVRSGWCSGPSWGRGRSLTTAAVRVG